ncbi:MAG: superoxide dismutase [Candidatus Aenigmatarchaeota archaeon]
MKKYELPPLPYSYDALEPIISREIMTLHHDKHHAAYVNGANAALERLEKFRKGEAEIDIKATLRDLTFNLNGHILHSIFWPNMRSPQENNRPGGMIADLINRDFQSFDSFKREFSNTAKTVEGSGWAILGLEPITNQLIVMQVEKHNLSHIANLKILLALDVWEHAYYLDYKNDRAKYVDNWWQVVNWDDVEKRLSKVL